jgi:hypothetical protein
VRMLRSAATKAAQLSEDGHDMSAFEAAGGWAERTLHAAAAKRALAAAQSFNLAAISTPASSAFCVPSGRLPAAAASLSGQFDQAAARQRSGQAAVNLGTVALLPAGQASFSQMKHALRSCDSNDSVSAQVVLRSVESQLFSRARARFEEQLNPTGLANLEAVVDEYRLCACRSGGRLPLARRACRWNCAAARC